MIDWERLRERMRPDLNRIISQDKLSEKDYCDLKLILSNMERTYTNEMFEKEQYENGESRGYNRSSYGVDPYMSTRPSGRVAPYYDHMNTPEYYGANRSNASSYGNNYSTHSQEELFKSQLQGMMHTAQDANTRHVIQEAMDKLR